jgi:hypothetical protein
LVSRDGGTTIPRTQSSHNRPSTPRPEGGATAKLVGFANGTTPIDSARRPADVDDQIGEGDQEVVFVAVGAVELLGQSQHVDLRLFDGRGELFEDGAGGERRRQLCRQVDLVDRSFVVAFGNADHPEAGVKARVSVGDLTSREQRHLERVGIGRAELRYIGPRDNDAVDDEDAAGNPATDVKTMAFILLVSSGPPQSSAHASAIRQVDTFRATWQTYVNGPATGGRGRFDTSLNPAIH